MFELLSEPIRKYIRDKRWESLRPIQVAAINKILTTDDHIILASKTASGKTEAAFLPILSKVKFTDPGVQVLYISPLIALINDQFNRIEELCGYLDVDVTKWHGEAKKSLKEKLIKNPRGVVLITPESLEAMLANAPYNAQHLFCNLKYIVIDEIHSFIGSDRGIQLKSILSRLQFFNKSKCRIVGLSATIGDYSEAKKITGDPINTKILLDKEAKSMEALFKYFEMEGNDLPVELLQDLYTNTKNNKVLIFPNSRGRAEEISVRLKKISDKQGGHQYYFSHHSSIDKELREYIEQFAKNNKRFPFAISCTSTLELGIDIGTVDSVVQIDATHSIASLIQRVGRSGRRDGEASKLLFYATNKWSLLQSLACLSLYKEGYIEPILSSKKPYDILLHQILALVKQLSGCTSPTLQSRIRSNFAFSEIHESEVIEIVDELVKQDLLELIGNELIIGVEGEKIVNNKDFYSVFKTDPMYKVVNYDRTIGEIPLTEQIRVDENILLAARIWKVIDVDFDAHKISVITARDGKKPKFLGSGADVYVKIRERMLELLKSDNAVPDLDEVAFTILKEMKNEFAGYKITDLTYDRPLIIKEKESKFYAFTGSKVGRTLRFLFQLIGANVSDSEIDGSFIFSGDQKTMYNYIIEIITHFEQIDPFIDGILSKSDSLLSFSKWGKFLPIKYQRQLVKDKHFDFEGTINFIQNLNLVVYK